MGAPGRGLRLHMVPSSKLTVLRLDRTRTFEVMVQMFEGEVLWNGSEQLASRRPTPKYLKKNFTFYIKTHKQLC